jgi:hypothetical protein
MLLANRYHAPLGYHRGARFNMSEPFYQKWIGEGPVAEIPEGSRSRSEGDGSAVVSRPQPQKKREREGEMSAPRRPF